MVGSGTRGVVIGSDCTPKEEKKGEQEMLDSDPLSRQKLPDEVLCWQRRSVC